MPTYSLITAVLDGHQEHLPQAYESLTAQELPAGWDWQWVVQEDGDTGRPLALLPSDPRLSPGTGPRSRAATARTLALSRSKGVIARALDADDLLLDGALARDIQSLTKHQAMGWCLSPTVDLMPDGTRHPSEPWTRSGRLPIGSVLEACEHLDLLAIAGSPLCAHTDLIRAVGGWQAVPANDDVALLLAVAAVSDGWMIDAPSLVYRRWPGNTTDALDAANESAADARRSAILDRAYALSRAGWRWRPRQGLAP
jgi:hypothetical protein